MIHLINFVQISQSRSYFLFNLFQHQPKHPWRRQLLPQLKHRWHLYLCVGAALPLALAAGEKISLSASGCGKLVVPDSFFGQVLPHFFQLVTRHILQRKARLGLAQTGQTKHLWSVYYNWRLPQVLCHVWKGRIRWGVFSCSMELQH